MWICGGGGAYGAGAAMTPLDQVIAHVRAKARPGQFDAILLGEVDRLTRALRVVCRAASQTLWSTLDPEYNAVMQEFYQWEIDQSEETGDV